MLFLSKLKRIFFVLKCEGKKATIIFFVLMENLRPSRCKFYPAAENPSDVNSVQQQRMLIQPKRCNFKSKCILDVRGINTSDHQSLQVELNEFSM